MKLEIIPVIKLRNGSCVSYSHEDAVIEEVYNDHPLEQARIFEAEGIKSIQLVDLDGAEQQMPVQLNTLEEIASQTTLKISFGGGVRKKTHIRAILDSGASVVSISSMALEQPHDFEEWLDTFGGDAILLAADIKGERIYTHGWQNRTQQTVFEFVEFWQLNGLQQFSCTDISKDGTLSSLNFSFYEKLRAKFPTMNIIVGGGVSSNEDLKSLDKLGINGANVGRALYENKISFNA